MSKNQRALEMLDSTIRDYFLKELGHNELTAVQECTIQKMLTNFDCIVQAPTGSGKSLAYILPTMQIVNNKRTKLAENEICHIVALVVVPSRELVNQIFALIRRLCSKLHFNCIRLFGSSGAKKKKVKVSVQQFSEHCVVVTTPGRFESFMGQHPQLKGFLKSLEVLIIDEADKFTDPDSRRSICTLLSAVPKQRRSSLFSATQISSSDQLKVDELARFGLRNPLHLIVDVDNKVKIVSQGAAAVNDIKSKIEENGDELESDVTTPKELKNYYAIVPAECKFLALLTFLKSQKNSKMLVFVSNASQCEYFEEVVRQLLNDEKRVVLSLHRKMEQKRQKTLNRFRSTKRAILFSTDILARGIDVFDIDWVLHFDFPKLTRLFVHRSGRAGRMGREGRALVLLTEEESAYVEFLEKEEKISLEECEFGHLTIERAQEVREKVQQLAIGDRKILELGSAAFVSFIEAYTRHDSQIVCKLSDLNIAGLAHAFGLLRLPKLRELKGRTDVIENFKPRNDIETSKITFKNAKLERNRQNAKERQKKADQKRDKRKTSRQSFEEGVSTMKKEFDDDATELNNGGSTMKKKRKRPDEWDQFQKGAHLLKKFRKGKLSKVKLEEEMNDALS